MKTEELSVCLVQALKSAGKTVATAESCTGGGIGHALTAVSGSSAVYAGGVISYTNAIKERVLNVPSETLEKCGAVSSETAGHMAKGVQKLMMSDFGVSVTGIAGTDVLHQRSRHVRQWLPHRCGLAPGCSRPR